VGVSFAEQMLGDPAAIPQRLQILVRLQARIHRPGGGSVQQPEGLVDNKDHPNNASRRAATADLAESPQGDARW